jgi:uncharacterized protein involved in exopolysaccharide biosynthesis
MTEDLRLRGRRYATVVFRWAAISAVVFVGVMSGGVYVTDHVLPKVYSATASLQVQMPTGSSESAYSGWTFSTPQSRAVQAELANIESPEILRAVISDLDLDKAWADRVFHRADPLTTEEAVHYLASHLRPKFKHDSHVVEVTALSDDPKEAAQIANEIVNLYKDSRADLAREESLAPGDSPALAPGTVQITARASVPTEPSAPNKRICYAIAAGFAAMLGAMIASSLEICLLIARAEADSGALIPPK